jgi:hypothetical protein
MDQVYEVVTGQILLSHRERFFELHSTKLLPIMKEIGIKPTLLLITEIGRYGRFLDVYQYESFPEYIKLTDQLLSHPAIPAYYSEVGKCIEGSIQVEIMRDLPYASHWFSQ